ncbi:hypothetical protein AB6A40_000041 [Gnathostoma spinigerum]|uniref:Vesicle transport protein n=1 Tax=Gnathostoma spinigerum TaxID=75299 RepID=A0ABD6E3C0_9BILA
MSALEEYVNQQKAKASISNVTSGITSSLSSLGSKISTRINGLPLLSRSATDPDSESLISSPEGSGQLPPVQNRKSSGWMSSLSGEDVCGMSRAQRIIAFFMSLIGALFCFGTAIMLLPVLVLSARKFAALNTLGSIMLILSFAFLWGPMAYFKHMISEQRRYVTIVYVGTVLATLYASLWVRIISFYEICFISFCLLTTLSSYQLHLKLCTLYYTHTNMTLMNTFTQMLCFFKNECS